MNDNLTTQLDQALAQIRFEPATAEFSPHSDHADRLAPLLKTAATLLSLPEPAPLTAGQQAADRAAFLAQIDQLPAPPVSPGPFLRLKGWTEAQLHTMRSVFSPQKERNRMQTLLMKTAVSLMLVLGVGGGTAVLASDSQPSSPLYPVKLMLEDAQLALSNSPAEQGTRQILMAQERVQEMKQAALAGHTVPTRTQLRLQTHLEQALKLAAQSSEQEMGQLLNRLQAMLQVQTATTNHIQARAGEGAQQMLGELTQTLNQYQEQVQAALQDPQTFRWQHGQNSETEPPYGPQGPNCGEDCEPAGNQNQHGQDAAEPGGPYGPGSGEPAGAGNGYGPDEDAPQGPHGPGAGDCGQDCAPLGDQHKYGKSDEAPAGPYGPGAAGDVPDDNENRFGQEGDGAYGPGVGPTDPGDGNHHHGPGGPSDNSNNPDNGGNSNGNNGGNGGG